MSGSVDKNTSTSSLTPQDVDIDERQKRAPYAACSFSESQLAHPQDPFVQFQAWYSEVKGSGLVEEPNAMHLATASAAGRPSVRTLLMKSLSTDRGLVFFTNYRSRKAKDLLENPWAAVNFYWAPLHRCVRVEGSVEKLSDAESTEYFRSRPRESQIGAYVSEVQSSPVQGGRETLEAARAAVEARFSGVEVLERPAYWGGFCLTPDSFEFWQGQTDRIHDRIVFTRREGGVWNRQRLYP